MYVITLFAKWISRGRIHDARWGTRLACFNATGVMNAAPTTLGIPLILKERQEWARRAARTILSIFSFKRRMTYVAAANLKFFVKAPSRDENTS